MYHSLTFRLRITLAILAYVLFTAPGFAQTSTISSFGNFSALTGDARLQRTVTIDETPIALKELLHEIGNEHLTLTCAPDCAERKLQIHVRNRSLQILMQSLARLLPGTWERDTGGYRFSMSGTAIQKEQRWWSVYMDAWNSALAAQRDYTLQKMRAELRPAKPKGTVEDFTPEQQEQMQQRNIADQMFYRLLPADLQEEIANHIDVTRYYRLFGYQLAFPKTGNAITYLSALPEADQKIVWQHLASLKDPPALDADLPIGFINSGSTITPYVILPRKTRTAGGPTLYVGDAPQALVLPLNHKKLAEAVRLLGRSASSSWKVLADYQESRVWHNDPPAPGHGNNVNGVVPRRRADVLNWLADRADIEYVSDYYSTLGRPFLGVDRAKAPEQPLKVELDQMAQEQDISWKEQPNGVYLFRNNRWYRDDKLEVSASLLEKWLPLWLNASPKPDAEISTPPAIGPESLRLQMDWEAEFVTKLTPWQIANGLAYCVREPGKQGFNPNDPPYTFRPFSEIAEHILVDYNIAVFYASLNSEQRNLLVHGELPATSLSVEQQKQALALMPELSALVATPSAIPVCIGFNFAQPKYSFSVSDSYNPGYNIHDAGAPFLFPVDLVVISPNSESGSGQN